MILLYVLLLCAQLKNSHWLIRHVEKAEIWNLKYYGIEVDFRGMIIVHISQQSGSWLKSRHTATRRIHAASYIAVARTLFQVVIAGAVCSLLKHTLLNLLYNVMSSLNPSLCNRNYMARNLARRRFPHPNTQHRLLQVPGGFK